MRVPVLSAEEVQVLLTHLEKCSPRNNLIIRFMLQCGLRAGEVSDLNIENVWRAGYVHPAVYLPRSTTKGHVARYVDMPRPVKELVGAYVAALDKVRSPLSPESPLFMGLFDRGRLQVSGIERLTAKICKDAIGRTVHPHLLRHTFATILLNYTNIRVVQMLLGHAKLNTTEIYLHPNSEECRTAVNQAFNR